MQYLASLSSNIYMDEGPDVALVEGPTPEACISQLIKAFPQPEHSKPTGITSAKKKKPTPIVRRTLGPFYLLELEGEKRCCFTLSSRPPEPRPEDMVWVSERVDDIDDDGEEDDE